MRRRRYKELPSFLRKGDDNLDGRNDDDLGSYQPLLAIWLIEMALTFEWYRKPRVSQLPDIVEDGNHFGQLTNISINIDRDTEDEDEPDIKAIRRTTNAQLENILRDALEHWKKQPLTGELTLIQNIEMLGDALALTPADLAVLTFAMVMKTFGIFERIVTHQNQSVSNRQLARLIETLTGQSADDVIESLRSDSRLIASGMVTIERGNADLESKIDVMNILVGTMLMPHKSKEDLARHFLRPASPSTLTLDAYPHLASDITTLKEYLTNLRERHESGINILFYGPPGTGKTELVKALAKELGQSLYEINFSDEDGDPISGPARLRAYNFSKRLLEGNHQAMLMFDEIEDVISGGSDFLEILMGSVKESKTNKAWINRTMERNQVPTIWVTNNQQIDPAYRRRFDYSVYFPVPPSDVRVEIARHHLGEVAPNDDWLRRIASNEQVSPGQYERMAKVARIVGGEARHVVAERTLDRSMRLMGQKRQPCRNTLYTSYTTEFINSDLNVVRLLEGLMRRPNASICLYGPPGTGKSEFARHVADQIHRPLVLRRASDLLDMYVGGTEANIAEMFMEAREREAVLLLDEADSFLQDRRGATRSWEITQVNELLTQMEAFDGVFICTTNLMANLDSASLRRFSIKAQFDYLTPDQSWSMFNAELTRLGGTPDAHLEPQVRRLAKLTPGDFAVAARQIGLWSASVDANALLEMLKREVSIKGHGTAIGFVS